MFEPLAIIGTSCRLPGARNKEEFWELVRDGRDATGPLPQEILDQELYYDPEKGVRGKSYSTIGGLVPKLPFDNSKCQLPGDPEKDYDEAHLTMCSVAAEALRDASYDPFALPNRNVGVYFGHTGGTSKVGGMVYSVGIEQTAQYLHESPELQRLSPTERQEIVDEIVSGVRQTFDSRDPEQDGQYGANMGASLISKAFQLDGPTVVVDAACASSLQALTIASRALQHGSIDMAIVGGASCCKGDSLILFSAAQSVSADKSRPFDERANGLIAAEGYVTFVIKRLSDAVAAGDDIQIVIRGLGVSADGKGKSLWAPLKDGQKLAIERAYPEHFGPADVQFVEAHATSTQVGDATELSALAEAFGTGDDTRRRIPLGSVKANVGHTLETAGVAGMLKVMMAMKHGIVPPVANLETPNPAVPWDDLPFYLPRQAEPWQVNKPGETKKAAVNAFGIGGLNVHVVLEEYQPPLGNGGASGNEKTRDGRAATNGRPQKTVDSVEPIAIVGMGSILAGVRRTEDFWRVLEEGSKQLSQVTAERWDSAHFLAQPDGTSATKFYRCRTDWGGFCTDYEYDWRRHRVPPKQIAAANPLQFMLLDAADQALQEAGYLDKALDRDRVGVIVGTIFGGDFSNELQMGLRFPETARRIRTLLERRGFSTKQIDEVVSGYEQKLLAQMPALVDETGSFTSSTLASRITKTFNLRGGAMALDAGQGTGLAALSACVDILRSNECDLMICAAGQRSMDLATYTSFDELASSRLGTGFGTESAVPGEGCVVLLLKRQSDAERDGDKIYALVREVGSSSDKQNAMGKACERALLRSSIAANDVRLLEGLGSFPLPVAEETSQLSPILAETSRQHALSINSVADQFGFVGAAHPLIGVMKAALAADRGVIPAGPTGQTVVSSDRSVRPQDEAIDIRDQACSVVSVAAGETNATCYHALIEPVGRPQSSTNSQPNGRSDTISSSPRIVRMGAANHSEFLAQLRHATATAVYEQSPEAFSAGDQFRLAFSCASFAEFANTFARVQSAAETLTHSHRETWARDGVFYSALELSGTDVAFLFPGQGSQYPGMLASLVAENPVAARARRHVDNALSILGSGNFDSFAGAEATGLGTDLRQTQISLLITEWVCERTLREMGVRPSIVAGHSFGEYAAFGAAGVWSLIDSIRGADARTHAVNNVRGLDGQMAATNAPREFLDPLCSELRDVYVANINAVDQIVISGRIAAMQQAMERLQQHRYSVVPIKVPCPFHTPLLKKAADDLATALAEIPFASAGIRVVSTAGLGEIRDTPDVVESLLRQLVSPVDFPAMVHSIDQYEPALVVEVGPKQVLSRLYRSNTTHNAIVMACDDSRRGAALGMLDVVAQAECLVLNQPQRRPSGRPVPDVVSFDATARRRDRMRRVSKGETPASPRLPQKKGSSPVQENAGAPSSASPSAVATSPNRLVSAATPPAPATSAFSTAAFAAEAIAAEAEAWQAEPSATTVVEENELRQILIDFVVEQTGYPEEIIEMDADLEADLGIDSIKKAQLFGEIGGQFNIAPRADLSLSEFSTLTDVLEFVKAELQGRGETRTAGPSIVTPHTPATIDDNHSSAIPDVAETDERTSGTPSSNSASPARAELQQVLIEFVIEQTGYPEEIIEMDADLEGDLGIDSIKKAQLFGEIGSQFQISPREDLSLSEFATLNHVLEFLCAELGVGSNEQVDQTNTADFAVSRVEVSEPTHTSPAHTSPAHTSQPLPSPAISAQPNRNVSDVDGLREVLIDFVMEQTGYPEEIIEMDADLEAELGIDSIKKAQLFGEMGSRYNIAPREGLALSDFATLDDILQFLVQELGAESEHSSEEPQTPTQEQTHDADHEVGLAIGQALKEPIRRELATMADRFRAPSPRPWAASQLRQLRGIADGAQVNVEAIAAWDGQFSSDGAAGDFSDRLSALFGTQPTLPVSNAGELPESLLTEPPKMRRWVLRMSEQPVSGRGLESPTQPVYVVGERNNAAEIANELKRQGVVARPCSISDLRDPSLPLPRTVIVASNVTEAVANGDDSVASHFSSLFSGLQYWIGKLEERAMLEGSCLVALTGMGGDFGFSSHGRGSMGGGLTGLFKGIRREYPQLTVNVLDFNFAATSEETARLLIAELASGRTDLEVGFANGQRYVVTAMASSNDMSTAEIAEGGVWVVTGGGRGVTSVVAREFGRRYGLKLQLLGTAPEPAGDAPWQGLDAQQLKQLKRDKAIESRQLGLKPNDLWRPIEKAIELKRNLEGFRDAHVDANYYACDVADRGSLAATLEVIRAQAGPIQGVIHGAGVEAACRFTRKQGDLVRSTITSKCDGAANLMSLTKADPLKYFVGFGSTSGRFGGLGQADYSLASDLLAKMIGRFAAQRPDCRAVCFHWPAWGGVGMAVRPESRVALEAAGISFMDPMEGVAHVAAELGRPASEASDHEILICDNGGMLDTDGTMLRTQPPVSPAQFRNGSPRQVDTASPTTLDSKSPAASNSFPMLESSTQVPNGFDVTVRLDAVQDPFLKHHQFRDRPLLPAVMSLECIAEAVQKFWPERNFSGFSDVTFDNGATVSGREMSLTIRLRENGPCVAFEVSGPFRNTAGNIIESDRTYSSGQVHFNGESPTPIDMGEPMFGWTPFEYPKGMLMEHGPPLQTFKTLSYVHDGGRAELLAGDDAELFGHRIQRGPPITPSALLDGAMVCAGFYAFAMVEPVLGLPHHVGRYQHGRLHRKGEKCRLRFFYKGAVDGGHAFDLIVAGDSGDVLFRVDDYVTASVSL
jgi:acyl transferase domain-containing protein/NAD(P)-dependent dehydrogenase (short-subunit alcohol dehydrogenase family)